MDFAEHHEEHIQMDYGSRHHHGEADLVPEDGELDEEIDEEIDDM